MTVGKRFGGADEEQREEDDRVKKKFEFVFEKPFAGKSGAMGRLCVRELG